jgi:hypothetical protein
VRSSCPFPEWTRPNPFFFFSQRIPLIRCLLLIPPLLLLLLSSDLVLLPPASLPSSFSHSLTLPLSLSLSYTLSLTHFFAQIHSLSCFFLLSLLISSLSLSLTHTHTHTHMDKVSVFFSLFPPLSLLTLSLSPTHPHTHTHTHIILSFSRIVFNLSLSFFSLLLYPFVSPFTSSLLFSICLSQIDCNPFHLFEIAKISI